MHQTKKGNNYFFGMKAHIGVDLHTGLVHSVVGTAANVADVTQVDGLMHGEEELVVGDAGYQGVGTRAEHQEPDVQRSEDRRVGTECVSTCRSRGTPEHTHKK